MEDTDLTGRLTRTLGDAFALDGEIGRGGMGIVYRARDQRLKRAVAIKVLPPELAYRGDVRLRFLREAETAAQLSHPNIVPIFTVDERDGLVYFIMAYIDGDTLAARLVPGLPLPVPDARRIAREVADALAYAHGRGVIHRDIKPDNILLTREGTRAMVTDFGIARALTSDGGDGGATRLTGTGVAIGTPAYMSPEQCAGDRAVDGRSDLYSLGVVTYQMLTGTPPFVGTNSAGMLVKQLTEQPIPLSARRPDVPADLADTVMRLLEKDPARRPQTAAVLIAALDGTPVPRPLSGAAPAEPASTPPSAAARREADVEAVLLERRVRKFRAQVGRYAAISVFIIGINIVTEGRGGHDWWWYYPVFGMGLAAAIQSTKLLADGVSLKEALGPFWPGRLLAVRLPWRRRPIAPGGPVANLGVPANVTAQTEARAARLVPRQVLDGPYGPGVRRAVADQLSIRHLYDALDKGERALVPNLVTTADALLEQVGMVAVALHRIDVETPPERRPTLATRREALVSQLERACLALEALALDLIRLRSAGLGGSGSGSGSQGRDPAGGTDRAPAVGSTVTEQARAALLDIDYVLQAAAELRTPDPHNDGTAVGR